MYSTMYFEYIVYLKNGSDLATVAAFNPAETVTIIFFPGVVLCCDEMRHTFLSTWCVFKNFNVQCINKRKLTSVPAKD